MVPVWLNDDSLRTGRVALRKSRRANIHLLGTLTEGMHLDMAFIYFDGDDIRSPLELLLLDNRIEDAAKYSRCVAHATAVLTERLLSEVGGKVIVSGGDDVLIETSNLLFTEELFKGLARQFLEDTGRTISAGVGETASAAVDSLRRAKLSGKSRLVAERGVEGA